MRMRYGVYAFLAATGLVISGCGKADTTPPPDLVDETPVLDIDQGSEVSPDEVKKKNDPSPQTDDASGGGAESDAGGQ